MPVFVAWTRTTPLPDVGTPESMVLDFKQLPSRKARALPAREPSSWDLAEAAKDIAAFANAIGGTLLIGAEGEPRLRGWAKIDAALAAKIVSHYNDALTRHVQPKPVATLEVIERDETNRVVAVNVWPFPGQAVGARTIADAYTFSVRVNDQNVPYSPEQLPMLMIPELRRIATLLHAASDHRVVVQSAYLSRVPSALHEIVSVSEEHNCVVFKLCDSHAAREGWSSFTEVAFDEIDQVWRTPEPPRWNVRLRARR